MSVLDDLAEICRRYREMPPVQAIPCDWAYIGRARACWVSMYAAAKQQWHTCAGHWKFKRLPGVRFIAEHLCTTPGGDCRGQPQGASCRP